MKTFGGTISNRLIGRGILAFALASVVLVTVNLAFHAHFDGREQREVVRRYQDLAWFLISNELQDLMFVTRSLANLNETAWFVHQQTPMFRTRWLNSGVLARLNLDGMLVRNHQSRLIGSKSHLSEEQTEKVWDMVSHRREEINRWETDRGVILVDDHILLYATMPVSYPVGEKWHTSSANIFTESTSNAEVIGFYTLFREFNDSLLQHVGQELDIEFDISSLSRPSTPLLFDGPDIKGMRTTNVRTVGEEVVASFAITTRSGHDLPMMLVSRFPDPLTSADSAPVRLLVYIGINLLTTVFLLVSFNGLMLKPLTKVTRGLGQIGGFNEKMASEDLSRQDEIGELANNVQAVLERLSVQHAFSELLLESIGDSLLTVDNQGSVTYANPVAQKWLGLTPEQIYDCKLEYLLQNASDGQPSIAYWLNLLLEQGQGIMLNCGLRVISKPTELMDVVIVGHPIKKEDAITGGILVFRHAMEAR